MEIQTGSQLAKYGLSIKAEPTKTNVANTQLVGVEQGSIALTSVTKGYCVSATMGQTGDEFTLNINTGVGATSDTPVAQVETATAAGTISGSGNATVTVTGALIAGSPLAVSVAVVNADSAATWAGKVRLALGALSAITDNYTVGGSSTTITLTKKAPITANDTTLNIALDNGTCTGITPAATSTNTTAGVVGVAFTNNTGDGNDFEGIALGTLNDIYGVLVQVTEGAVSITNGTDTIATLEEGVIALFAGISNVPFGGDTWTVAAVGGSPDMKITVAGS